MTTPWRNEQGALTQTLVKARRVGGSTLAALLSILWCTGREMRMDGNFIPRRPFDVYIISKDFSSSKDMVREASLIANWLAEKDPDFECDPQATVVRFKTGCTINALACSPSGARGKTGGVICDEVPFWRRQDEMWAAVSKITDSNLGEREGYPKLLLGTPWDSGSVAHRLFTDGGLTYDDFMAGKSFPTSGYPFIRHRVDIFDAVKDGFPINIDKAFAELGIPELIETEYKCIWRGASGSFFPLDKLRAIQEDELPSGWQDWPVVIGVDCGGARGRDNTSLVRWAQHGSELWMTGVKAWNKPPDGVEERITWQADQIADWVLATTDTHTPITIAVDRGIMGADIIDLVRSRLKDKRRNLAIVGVGMAPADQERYAKAARRALERGQWRIYTGTEAGGDETGARALCLELSSLKVAPGEGGRLTFVTPRDASMRHRDRAWAALIGIARASRNVVREAADSSSAEESTPAVRLYRSALSF